MVAKRICTIYERHFLHFEFGIAVLLVIGFVFWTHRLNGWSSVDGLLAGNRAAVYGALASIFGSLLGFVLAAVAIVLGYADSERLTIIRRSQNWSTLWRVFTASMRSLGLATVAALVALVVDRDTAPVRIALLVCFFASALAILRVMRTLWVLEAIIKITTKPR